MTLPTVRDAIGRVGGLRSFRLAVGRGTSAQGRDPALRRAGVVEALAPGALEFLARALGPLSLVACADDGRGGVEAEAVIRLRTAGGIEGEVVLSRLRPLGAKLRLQGAEGEAEVEAGDLRPGAAGAALAAACVRRSRLVQPWEDEPPAAPGPLAGRKVVVIGATGFIGARLVEMLAEQGAEVTAAARNLGKAARIARWPVRLVAVDLADPGQVAAAVEGQEVVFSLAHDLDRSGRRNFDAYRRLADAAARAGVSRFVHTSSIAAYDAWPRGDLTEASPAEGDGHDYKTAKRAMERDLAARAAAGSFTAAILQPTLVYGPFSKLWTDRYAERLEAGDIVLPDQGRGLCNALYVDDLAQALALAGAARIPGAEPYIVSGARPVTWAALLEGYAAGLPGSIRYEPAPPPSQAQAPAASGLKRAAIGAVRPLAREAAGLLRRRLGEDSFERLRSLARGEAKAAYRPADAEPGLYRLQGACSIEKARRELGYAPRFELAAGLARSNAYIAWRRAAGAT